MTVISSFIYTEDNRVVLVFDNKDNAQNFSKAYDGRAEIFENPTHVFLQPPKGLQLVRAAPEGQMVFVFNDPKLSEKWATSLQGNGYVKFNASDDLANRSVFIGPALS